jgi:hypothetical protein
MDMDMGPTSTLLAIDVHFFVTVSKVGMRILLLYCFKNGGLV